MMKFGSSMEIQAKRLEVQSYPWIYLSSSNQTELQEKLFSKARLSVSYYNRATPYIYNLILIFFSLAWSAPVFMRTILQRNRLQSLLHLWFCFFVNESVSHSFACSSSTFLVIVMFLCFSFLYITKLLKIHFIFIYF